MKVKKLLIDSESFKDANKHLTIGEIYNCYCPREMYEGNIDKIHCSHGNDWKDNKNNCLEKCDCWDREVKKNEPSIINIDCNNCKHININEHEQSDKKEDHVCKLYNVRVFHNIVKAFMGIHDNKIYPCLKCKDDNYKNYENKF